MRFEVGEHAVCPPHGVAEVVAIETDDISGARETYYQLRVRHRRLGVMIPVRKAQELGLRALIRGDEIDRVFAILQRRPRRVTGPWPRMCRDLHTRLHSGSIFDAAGVARDLTWAKKQKGLSASAQRILDRAVELVVTEIAAATGRPDGDIQERVEVALKLPRRR